MTTETETSLQDVTAELIFTIANRAPDVIFTFNGLQAPIGAFQALQTLGWGVPAIPPPPGNAIDWTPDPTTGNDYTILPWKVTEFKLIRSPEWNVEVERYIGKQTIQVLKQHGVNITGLRGEADDESAAAVAGTPGAVAATGAAPQPSAEAESASPTAGESLIVALTPTTVPSPTGMTAWPAKAGRKREQWSWHEGPGISQDDVTSLTAQESRVWAAQSDTRPADSKGKTLLQMISTNKKGADKDIAKLEKLFGATPRAIDLSPTPGAEPAVLITAAVPTNSVEMIKSNLLLRFPKLIIRD